MPVEYTADHLKRQVVSFVVDHKEFFLTYLWKHILYEYNFPNSGHVFSFKSFLLYVLEKATWGDDMTLSILSIMWNVRATVIFPKSLGKLLLRHSEQDISNVELVVIYGGGSHYSAVGTYSGQCHVCQVDDEVIQVATEVSQVGAMVKNRPNSNHMSGCPHVFFRSSSSYIIGLSAQLTGSSVCIFSFY